MSLLISCIDKIKLYRKYLKNFKNMNILYRDKYETKREIELDKEYSDEIKTIIELVNVLNLQKVILLI